MHLFRNMQEPQSTDITQYPGYTKLSGDQQKKVAETYTNVYNNNQGKLGYRVAQGIAYETAKKMCESFVAEGAFDATRDASPGLVADEAGDGTVDKTISKPGPTYEGEKKKPVFKCSEKGCDITAFEHKHAGDKVYKRGALANLGRHSDEKKLWGEAEGDPKQATIPQAHKTEKVGMTEDEINEFAVSQTGKRFVMKDGVKHKVIGVRDGQLVTEPVKTKKKVTEGEAEEFQAANDNLVGMTEAGFEGLISAANPEEDGAARQLRLNHDKMCLGCGSVHPLDVMCFDGRTHSEAGAPGGGNGAADILKQNHAQKGMKGMGEQTDPLISAVASYLTNRAKVSGLMESLEEGAGDIQKKNLENKCPNCGSLKKDEKCPKCDSDQDVDDKKADDDNEDSEEILKKNHKEKGESLGKDVDEAELDEKHIGFKALQGKLERSGHSKESAGAIAASIGAKKYGKAAMHKAAASHTPLGEDEEIQEALDEIWDENFYPAKPLEESCGNCSHPKSYHMKACQTCNECTGFVAENTLEEKHKKDQICFCGHEFGGHSKGGCKVCKHEGVVKPERAAHQFKKNDWSEKFESDFAKIFAAQQGKINTTFANARLNWLPEELELTEGKGYEDIGPGDHVKFNHPLRGSDKVPQQGKGRVVMKGPAGWVLNSGGRYGTPNIVSPENYVSHRKAKRTVKEDEIQEDNNYPDYHEVLNKHGYKSKGADDEGHRYEHPNGSHVMLHASGSQDLGHFHAWTHKGKNKKLVGNTGDSPKSLDSHLKGVARAQRAGSARKDREDTMRSLGLNKVKGSVSGKTYWESEELGEEKDPYAEFRDPKIDYYDERHPNSTCLTDRAQRANHDMINRLANHLAKTQPTRYYPPSKRKHQMESEEPKGTEAAYDLSKVYPGHTPENKPSYEAGGDWGVTEEVDPLMAASLGYINSEVARAGGKLQEAEESDHTKNPYHEILTKHGFVHAGSKAEKNRFAPDKHEYVEHVYTHPEHGKSHVVVTQDTKYTGPKGSDYKPHHFVHRHEQSNGIMAPSSGDSKPQLHRSLSYHYGVPKGMEAPKLTAWEKKYPHGAPKYKMNEEE